jgi:hypothetical protein
VRLRARKTARVGRFLRVHFTLRSVLAFLRDVAADGHIDGTRPWSSLSIGPRGLAWNSRTRRVRADLPGPFYAESDPLAWTRDDGDPDDGCRYCGGLPGDRSRHFPGCSRDYRPPTPVTDEEAEAQDCPRCQAEAGYPCRTSTTGDPTEPHAARKARALAARQETGQP